MNYHFKVHGEKGRYWAECVELKGCMTQGRTTDELKKNCKEALDLYLDEPEDSDVLFPLPRKNVRGKNILMIEADPQVALATLVRRERLKRKWTQKTVAERLGVPLYSYQRLESSKTTNPEWKTLIKLRKLFPQLNLNLATV